MSDLTDRARQLIQDVEKLEERTLEAERTAETYLMASQDDEYLQRQIKGLHDFIADVRHGIRDLDEYEAVCGRLWV